jgi:hypothetical protein
MTSHPSADRHASRRPATRRAALLTAAAVAVLPMLALAPLAANAAPAGSASLSAAASTRAAAAAAVVPAVASGKLTPAGCTSTDASSVTCDLYAMTGTTQVLGQPIPIWGFSRTSTPGSATAPGPVLVVAQGTTVTVVLHNQLAAPVSLAFPGQPAADFTAGLSATAETVGAPTGGTQTYVFRASRPGTYLYEAGHTSGGARQVAMGLAGALVVLSPDGTAYGTPASAYDDEAVVVLSEIDPAFNAAPTTHDLRLFHPKYRLINGKPFPASDPIATDQGHKVLLRYVNVGSQPHPMSLLGADQSQLASDGHPLAYAEPTVVAAVKPGATLDSVVTMPTGPEAKLALFEAGGHLDNNGQTTADPLSFAFGGMLTFLDTAAPPPSVDGVGPASSHISVSPNPSSGLAPVTIAADVSDAQTGGNTVAQAEFVVDDAVTTGPGFGVPMTGAFGAVSVTDVTGTIPVSAPDCSVTPPTVALSCLEAGKHTVFVRGLDSAGNWGVIGSAVLNLPKTGPQTYAVSASPSPSNGTADVDVSATGDDQSAGGTITSAEYFIDAAGADGSGTALSVNRTAAVVSEDGVIPKAVVTALGEGTHDVLVHSRNSLGLWGPPASTPLVVDLTGPTVDAASVGPNPSNGIISDKSHPGYLVVSALITDRDAQQGLQSLLADAEAFLDPKVANPAGGTGVQLIAVDGALDSRSETVYGLLPLTQVRTLTAGTHHVFVRGQDAAGNWGSLFGIDLVIDKTAPVLGTPTATPNPTAGAANLVLTVPVNEASFATAEYWLGATDPGVGRATRLPVSFVVGTVVVTIPLTGITPGTVRFNLRVQDLAGNWSNAVNTSVSVTRPNAIFSDTFNSGSLAAWSARTGQVSVTPAAGIPVSAGNLGLQVVIPGGTANRVSYVTDNGPTAETSYHARFGINANTLTSGSVATSVLTLFEGRSAANAQVLAVEFRRSGGTPQVRAVMARSVGTPLVGAWVNLAAAAHTIQVDWLSGPATGGSAGSLRLSVDGVATPQLVGNTSTLRLETALLGVTAGVTATPTSSMAGTAYFDNFTSTRYTMP